MNANSLGSCKGGRASTTEAVLFIATELRPKRATHNKLLMVFGFHPEIGPGNLGEYYRHWLGMARGFAFSRNVAWKVAPAVAYRSAIGPVVG